MSKKRKSLTNPEPVELSFDELAALVEDIPEGKTHETQWTDAMDRILLQYYPNKNKEALSKLLGVCRDTMRSRWKALKEKEDLS